MTKKTYGLERPQLKYKWRVSIADLTKEQSDSITANAVSVSINYATRILSMVFRQGTESTALHEIFMKVMKAYDDDGSRIKSWPRNRVGILLESLDGDGKPEHALEFTCTPLDHLVEYDYTDSSGFVEHCVTFSIEELLPYVKKNEEVEEAA